MQRNPKGQNGETYITTCEYKKETYYYELFPLIIPLLRSRESEYISVL